MRLIYHPSAKDYPIYKSIGFTHVEISKTAWPGDYPTMIEAVSYAHAAGLHAAYAPMFFDKNGDPNHDGDAAISSAGLCDACIIMLDDEPNLTSRNNIRTKICDARSKKLRPDVKTSVTLSYIRPWNDFANVADIVFLDFYKRMGIFSFLRMIWRVSKFNAIHRGEFGGVAPVRYDSRQMRRHAKFWKFMGADHLAWYSATPDQEIPKWFDSDLPGMPDLAETLKKINLTSDT